MKEKTLITGISGFVGSHLTEYLVRRKMEVFGITPNASETDNLKDTISQIKLYEVNLLESDRVKDVIQEVKPDFVFHLAAMSSPAESFKKPKETLENNFKAQLNLLEAFRELGIHPRTIITSSADEYGVVEKKFLPVKEETPLNARSPYAASKVIQDFVGEAYFYSFGIPVIRIRAFNHIGPRQAPVFAVPSWSRQIAAIEHKKAEPVIRVGNLTPERDFTDVRDMVHAYFLAVTKAKPGQVYNIGSGKAVSMQKILDLLLSYSTIKDIRIEVDKNLLRPTDLPKLVANPGKFQKETSWKPKIPLTKTLHDTLSYWRKRERSS